jgi:hypothetical protein
MKMKNLERDDFIIQGVPWRIRIERLNSQLSLEDAYGRTDFDSHTITLAADMPWEETIETLVHETIHALVRGRESCDLTKEDEVRTFSIALVDTLMRNQLAFILDEDERGW